MAPFHRKPVLAPFAEEGTGFVTSLQIVIVVACLGLVAFAGESWSAPPPPVARATACPGC
jgi:hypothetical protein